MAATIVDRSGHEMCTMAHVSALVAVERGDLVPTTEAGTYRFASTRPVTSASPEEIAKRKRAAHLRAEKAQKENAR